MKKASVSEQHAVEYHFCKMSTLQINTWPTGGHSKVMVMSLIRQGCTREDSHSFLTVHVCLANTAGIRLSFGLWTNDICHIVLFLNRPRIFRDKNSNNKKPQSLHNFRESTVPPEVVY